MLRTGALPRWNGWLALVFVPTMYFGNDFRQFYSAAGDGPAATGPLALVVWILATALGMVRKRRPQAQRAASPAVLEEHPAAG